VLDTATEEVLPRLRGWLHAASIPLAVAGLVVLVTLADDGRSLTAAVVYGLGLCGLFSVSAAYHRWPPASRLKRAWRRADHAMIFVFIAASYTPIALLVLDHAWTWVVLASAWFGALLGVTFSLGWIDAPRGWTAGAYIALGWIAVVVLPQLLSALGVAPVALIGAGGVCYTAGAVVYARQSPNPWPRTFGYHEIFHALVIAAAAAHFAAMAGWVLPSA
jgi:hemolysin III